MAAVRLFAIEEQLAFGNAVGQGGSLFRDIRIRIVCLPSRPRERRLQVVQRWVGGRGLAEPCN